MPILRTPSSIFHPAVSFIANGELANEDNLNLAPYALDDKAQFLKDTQDTEIARGAALASIVGEVYDSTVTATTWNSPTHFVQGASHHAAIEGLDQNLSALAANTDLTRIDNIDTFLIGEDSTTGQPPDWSTVRTPFVIQLGDTHHEAINRLDAYASSIGGTSGTNESCISTLKSQVATLITDLGLAEAAIGSLQTEVNAISTITFAQGSSISTLDSRLIVTRTETSTIGSSLDTVSTLVDENSCVIEKMKSQINVLRAQHAFGAITVWCP